MIYSDKDIKWLVESGEVSIKPFNKENVQPASYDITLSNEFLLLNRQHLFIDPLDLPPSLMELVDVGDKKFVLHPSEFVLGSSFEYITLGNSVACRLEGKSSLGRVGLVIHSTAGWFDPGFHGNATLELSNVSTLPILLTPGMLIGQLSFWPLSSSPDRPYGHPDLKSKYQGQVGPTASKIR